MPRRPPSHALSRAYIWRPFTQKAFWAPRAFWGPGTRRTVPALRTVLRILVLTSKESPPCTSRPAPKPRRRYAHHSRGDQKDPGPSLVKNRPEKVKNGHAKCRNGQNAPQKWSKNVPSFPAFPSPYPYIQYISTSIPPRVVFQTPPAAAHNPPGQPPPFTQIPERGAFTPTRFFSRERSGG